MRYHNSFDPTMSLVSFILLCTLVLLLLALFLLVKAGSVIMRAWLHHPEQKALWITTSLFLILVLLVVITNGLPVVLVFMLLSGLALLLTAWIINTFFDERCQKPPEPLINEVLQQPWWDTQAA